MQRTINTPEDLQELKNQLDAITKLDGRYLQGLPIKKPNVFKRVVVAIKG